jgi:hypothetical protein
MTIKRRYVTTLWFPLVGALSAIGCAEAGTAETDLFEPPRAEGEPAPDDALPNLTRARGDAPVSTVGSFGEEAGLDLIGDEDPELGASARADDMDCGTAFSKPEVIRTPVDIIVVLDNSGSMGDESESVEKNINDNFARILDAEGVNYRMILISEHRERNGQNAICVTRPLSELGQCPAPVPVASERFFHYSVEVGSRNSLGRLLDTYDGSREDEFRIAPGGWSEWLRPGVKKVFLEFTDDDANLSAPEFIQALSALAPQDFGTPEAPSFVWHSIVGLAEKDVPTDAYLPSDPVEGGECRGNRNNVYNAGETYQELSQLTGGLRFPICQFQAYDTVFQTIASDLLAVSAIQCEFPLPSPPSGRALELDKVALSYVAGSGDEPRVLGQASSAQSCQADAFFIDGGSVQLCPEACDSIRADGGARIDVLFTCNSTLILR